MVWRAQDGLGCTCLYKIGQRHTQSLLTSQDCPTVQRQPRKPWISAGTIRLLEARDTARQGGDHVREHKINVDMKRSVVQDRTRWLNDKLKDGCWNEVHHLRRGSRKGLGPLRDENGDAIDSVNYADAIAQYFADVQWAVRPVSCMPDRNSLGPPVPVSLDDMSQEEVIACARKLHCKKAQGMDTCRIFPMHLHKGQSSMCLGSASVQLCVAEWSCF